ncbi:hypothetical protein C9374_014448 [Naegleria lovaniensis]|uniref:Uncharacterized protein n=1 Tax=Naegleria lovaniensis TaxID=51637 RepID=A0AA88KP51_NAELO|nr:uncharacterized protein C9374_014448 [Naegleria lovaniensis]KAG2389048.1 hypothetical protein C9374_014448 [Naegleria lovaniensis]
MDLLKSLTKEKVASNVKLFTETEKVLLGPRNVDHLLALILSPASILDFEEKAQGYQCLQNFSCKQYFPLPQHFNVQALAEKGWKDLKRLIQMMEKEEVAAEKERNALLNIHTLQVKKTKESKQKKPQK